MSSKGRDLIVLVKYTNLPFSMSSQFQSPLHVYEAPLFLHVYGRPPGLHTSPVSYVILVALPYTINHDAGYAGTSTKYEVNKIPNKNPRDCLQIQSPPCVSVCVCVSGVGGGGWAWSNFTRFVPRGVRLKP